MKLSVLIKNLNHILKDNGDLTVAYATDEEGNDYNLIQYNPTVGLYDDNEFIPEENIPSKHKSEIINSVCVN